MVKHMNEIKIETDFIKLDSFLKLAAVVQTGGQAKMMIADGMVKVNGEVCTMRGKKLRKEDVIEIEDYDTFIVI